MKLTAPIAIPERPVDEKHVVDWVNDEAVPLLRQLRQALNAQLRERPTSAMSDGAGTYKRLWTSDVMPSTAVWGVIAEVVGVSTVGTFQAARYTVEATFRSQAGALAAVGAPTVVASHETDALCDARLGFDAVNRVVYLEACDNALSPMRWSSVVRLLEATP